MAASHEILVIGTGFAGIGMGVKLRSLGITDFALLERADGVGGTWRDNHYPGAACSAGKITALWPRSTYTFRKRTEHFDVSKYDVTLPTAGELAAVEASQSDVITPG